MDRLVEGAHFDPIARPITHDAADTWAEARQMGRSFTVDDRLDDDAILIAHTRVPGNLEEVAVITEDIDHPRSFVPAVSWEAFEI